ncbi:MAG: NAD-dependent epimerase/dehydratase family protein [Candidatus Cloacimonetes bacterium]|nr:NAD-dependent epimerase/dehydratase family protein [Candidatus Cloacimonadota bacterium]
MRMVLTGASGFLGGHLLVELLRRKIPVLALGRAPEELSRRLGTGVTVARFDLGNPGPTAALRAGDTVIHMAALLGAGVSDRALMLRANREATILLAAAEEIRRRGRGLRLPLQCVRSWPPWLAARSLARRQSVCPGVRLW